MAPLTTADVSALLDLTKDGDWLPLMAAIDPNVKWTIVSDTKDTTRGTGIFNLASWQTEVALPLRANIEGQIKLKVTSIDVIGNKAIVEGQGEATQKNGKPYNNRYAYFLIFSDEKKIVEIREYLDSALVMDVLKG
ncbi:hypothetical protein B0H15DRAFT_825725 [Mycena belliarum]|uniref:SnoaL-like domain-containing protein n=1 Tax=Mycena belliarum TaxID=1033014 RepID=A0AAD6UEX6_9AGAR|nr:hypothetical protein B0H15DRAFT_825725 [Mycena belliae]